ncbi:MAG: YfiR family protein [Methylococcaceae bacterium]
MKQFIKYLAFCSGKASIALLCFLSIQVHATESVSEKQLKTIYIYNFSRFVQWPKPKTETKTFNICTYPRNSFGGVLYQLEARKIQHQNIKIIELEYLHSIQHCHVVFIDAVSDIHLEKLNLIAKKHYVLTVSDQDDFVVKEGMIQLFVDKDKIRFNLNFDSSQAAFLKIDSKLIKLASTVIKKNIN